MPKPKEKSRETKTRGQDKGHPLKVHNENKPTNQIHPGGPSGYVLPFDFLQYFDIKLRRMQRDSEKMTELLDSYKESTDMNLMLEQKLRDRDTEAFRLQQCLNEAQLSLYEERESNQKIVAEHDKLTLEKDDFRRKFQTALLLGGKTEDDVTYFLHRHPKANEITDEMIKVKQQIRSCKGDKVDAFGTLDARMIPEEIGRLENALVETRRLQEEKRLALKESFRICKAATSARIQQLEDRLSVTVDQLNEKTALLHKSLIQNLELQKRILVTEDEWMAERKRFMPLVDSRVESNKNQKSDILGSAPVAGGHSGCKEKDDQDGELKRLERNSARLEGELMKKENMILDLNMAVIRLEKQMSRLREESDTYRKASDTERKALQDRNQRLRKRVDENETRRKLDEAGFRAEIDQIKKLLRFVEKHLEKAVNSPIASTRPQSSNDTKSCQVPSWVPSSVVVIPRGRAMKTGHGSRSTRARSLTGLRSVPLRGVCDENSDSDRIPLVKHKRKIQRVLSERSLEKVVAFTKEKVKLLDEIVQKRSTQDKLFDLKSKARVEVKDRSQNL